MQSSQAMGVGACFTAASLFEVCIQPSPGLVSPRDSGGHTDMNLLTFMLGSSVLAPYFAAFAQLGRDHEHRTAAELFTALRQLGQRAERDLMTATDGVNTQRGQLFLLGLAAGIASWCLVRGDSVPSAEFYTAVRAACDGLCDREFGGLTMSEAKTTGERLHLEQGVDGIRGEAEAGFPAVEYVGYPAFEDALQKGLSLNDAAVHTLISIMAELADTTVLGRLGKEGLATMHTTAIRALALGSVYTDTGRAAIMQAHRVFSDMRLSPGGAADLLALTMALYFVKHGLPGREALMTPSLFERLR